MAPKDDASAKAAEIGESLIESLGFEPAEKTELGRTTVTDVSDQISEAGFSITEAMDSATSSASSGNGSTKLDERESDDDADSDLDDVEDLVDLDDRDDTDDIDDEAVDETEDDDADVETLGDLLDLDEEAVDGAAEDVEGDTDAGDEQLDAEPSSVDSSTNGSAVAEVEPDEAEVDVDADGHDVSGTDSTDGEVNAHDTVVMDGPPTIDHVSAESKESNGVSLIEALDIVPLGAAAAVPTSPPVADTTITPEAPAEDDESEAPAFDPAVTGEHAKVEVATPAVTAPTPAADNRSIVERPRSVTDLVGGMFTGRRRLQARKVRRVIRHIDPWSVLTFSVLFHLCLFAALLLASVLVWNVADEAGTIENLENFIRELGDYESFEIDGEAIFRAAVAIAGILTLAASVLVVLLTVMFNLLSDLLGGIRITVIEEETVRIKPQKGEG